MTTAARIRAIASLVALAALAWLGFAPRTDAHTVYAAALQGNVVPITGATAHAPIADVSSPRAIAITPDGATVYVTSYVVAGKVYAIDASDGSVKAQIAVGDLPFATAVAPDGERVYVVNVGGNSVSVIDTDTNAVVGTVSMGGSPLGIAVAPDGKRAYVTGSTDENVSVIDTEANTVVDTIPLGLAAHLLAITPDGKRLYVANADDDAVSVIDTDANTAVETIPAGNYPFGVAITPVGAYAYVTNFLDDTVTVIDTDTNVVVDTIAVGHGPSRIAITPDGRTAYVNNAGDGTVSVLDLSENAETAVVPVGNGNLAYVFPGIAIAPNQPPTAALGADTLIVYAGEPVTFDASESSDDVGIATYTFNFGDGTQATTGQSTRKHVYPEPGTYEATVTVDDGDGCEPLPEFFEDLGLASPFTGQTAYCNGPSRVTSEPVAIQVEDLPALGLAVSLERPQSSLRSVRLTAACRNLDCDARAFGRIEVRRPGSKPKRFKLEPDQRELSSDEPATLAPRIPAKARRGARKALAAGGKVHARVRVRATGLGGQQRVALRHVRIVG